MSPLVFQRMPLSRFEQVSDNASIITHLERIIGIMCRVEKCTQTDPTLRISGRSEMPSLEIYHADLSKSRIEGVESFHYRRITIQR